MKFSINWLNDYVDLSDIEIEELVNKLTLSGFEVESIEYAGKSLENIVVARIEKNTNFFPLNCILASG